MGKKVSKHRRKACARKTKFYYKEDAINSVNYYYKKWGVRLTIYKCNAGGFRSHWHTAHKTPRKYRK